MILGTRKYKCHFVFPVLGAWDINQERELALLETVSFD